MTRTPVFDNPLPEAADLIKRQDVLDLSNNMETKAMAASQYDGDGTVKAAGGIKAFISSKTTPAGTIQMFAGATAPAGFLLCQGQAVSRITYADLYAVCGTAYGAGDGSTTFNLPDLRGNFPLGVSSSYARGAKGGAATHTLLVGELPQHRHNSTSGERFLVWGGGGTSGALGAGSGNNVNLEWATNNVGSNMAHNNMPPYIALNYIIKY